jgi:hypothetical protein
MVLVRGVACPSAPGACDSRDVFDLLQVRSLPRGSLIEEFNRELQVRLDCLDRGEYVIAEEFKLEMQGESADRRKCPRVGALHV